jgi:hypothetical protein
MRRVAVRLWSMQASKPSSIHHVGALVGAAGHAHHAAAAALASWPTALPTAPLAALTTTVSPAWAR